VSEVVTPQGARRANELALLAEIERKVLWIACWMVHNANHNRPARDGLKVGGHQASSASIATVLTALYFDLLEPQDRVAIKPHASPVFHAIQYLLGNQAREKLEAFRAFGGAQSYPSRTKDADDVDFSTGSVGLGVGVTLFASLVQDYVRLHRLSDRAPGRLVAVMGDAELDEGNIFEALLEGWKHDVRNLWWVVDYNRQSLDGVVNDFLFQRIQGFFRTVDWEVVNVKYGKRLEAAFRGPAGEALRRWIDDCPNQLYSALTFKGGAAWRSQLRADLGGTAGLGELLDGHDDASLAALMTNLGGHDLEALLEAFHGARDDRPRCFVAYTIKGFGTPLAGHKDNHAGLMTPEQMERFRAAHGVAPGKEWEPFAGLRASPEALRHFLDATPFKRRQAAREPPKIPVPAIAPPEGKEQSTQEAFGRVLNDLAKRDDALARRIVTTSPDVTVSTNLGGWVNQRGVFDRNDKPDVFREQQVASAFRWAKGPRGQHIELGIAENNLFLLLAALGLSHEIFGARLLPIGTLYDPFIARGLDALNYACYMDARFILVATPSGLTLAPEGGAHQSIGTPLIGMAQDGLAAFEPAYADETAAILEWAFDYVQRGPKPDRVGAWLREESGGSVYLRLSTRKIAQPPRVADAAFKAAAVEGGYWLKAPAESAEIAVISMGAIAPEALAAWTEIAEDVPGAGLLAVTSADRLNAGWHAAVAAREAGEGDARASIERLLAPLAPDAVLVTVLDGHPATLSWIGGVRGQVVRPLGVEHFGQSGDLLDLYRKYRIDKTAIVDAAAGALVERARRRG
jgi:pyruvate dehydrogenase E1 component